MLHEFIRRQFIKETGSSDGLRAVHFEMGQIPQLESVRVIAVLLHRGYPRWNVSRCDLQVVRIEEHVLRRRFVDVPGSTVLAEIVLDLQVDNILWCISWFGEWGNSLDLEFFGGKE